VRCEVIKPVAGRDSEHRPLCARCAQRPQRVCGRCGRIRRIARRARGEQPDICDSCFQQPQAICSGCGRARPCSFASTATPICISCAPRRTAVCAHCAADKPPVANWAEGPVCDPCYTAALRHRGTCSNCHTRRRLVHPPGPDAEICADCAGLAATHVCTDCGLEDKLYERGRCQRCALRRRTSELLRAGNAQIPAALLAVHDAITATSTPRTALNWLRNGAGAAVLADLAAGTTPISHAALDAHPRRRGADYLRHVLVAAQVLPARDEGLARLETWVTSTVLANIANAEHRRLLHAYATWRILRRARRRAERNNNDRTPTNYPRTQLLTAARFLDWLEHRGVALGECRQSEVDHWLTTEHAGCPVRDFLNWAAEHHHSTTLIVPSMRRATGPATDADERWTLLARLLHDDTLNLTDRVAGSLLLCYGQQLSRIAVMTTEQIHRHDDHVSLSLATHHITVAEPLAGLLTQLVDVGRSHRGVGSPVTTTWLFPGHLPGRPITASRLGERLRLLGVRALPARRATLLQLAAQVPAAVLAELLNLTPGTATRWTRDAAGDWSRLRRRTGHRTRSPTLTNSQHQTHTSKLFDRKATLLVTGIAGGADIQVVKERMGHSSITTTQKYLHTLPNADHAAVSALDNIRKRNTG
jgi:integrase